MPPLSLYIHLPWCERKCPYCDFNSHETEVIPEDQYVTALLNDLRGELHLLQGRSIETLFIGGGTPSLFSVNAMRKLMQGVRSILPLAKGLEATMESNPGSSEADKLAGFRDAGINRLSLGIQSFNDSQLLALGRVHNAEKAHAAIAMAQAAGFDNLNIDLMHGLPGQTLQQAISDLHTACTYQPTHLSWYQLTIEPNTLFHKHPPLLPVEDCLASIQDCGTSLLAEAGYQQYEVSAFSRPGFNCRHNSNYWSFGDYLGIGAGAHGKITLENGSIVRYAKLRQPTTYMAAPKGSYYATKTFVQRDEICGEFMLNALRLNDGFSLPQFFARTGLPAEVLEPKLRQLTQQGLLINKGGKIKASALGLRFLDSVVAEFFPD